MDEFDEVLCLLSEGIEVEPRPLRRLSCLRDRVQGRIAGAARELVLSPSRMAARFPTLRLFAVIVQPEGIQIATLDEDFAIESSAGDIILLGNASWRIQRVESAGRVLVEDAHMAAADGALLARRGAAADDGVVAVSSPILRTEIDERTRELLPGYISQTNPFCSSDGYMAQGSVAVSTIPARSR